MSISIVRRSTTSKLQPKDVRGLVDQLRKSGFQPLLVDAKQKFLEVLGGPAAESLAYSEPQPDEFYYRYARFTRARSDRVAIAGDLFSGVEVSGLHYVALLATEIAIARASHGQVAKSEFELEIGFIGLPTATGALDEFNAVIDGWLKEHKIPAHWTTLEETNAQFAELSASKETKFVSGESIPAADLDLASHLQDGCARKVALLAKRSGSLLPSELDRRSGAVPQELQGGLQKLHEVGLLAREYVVICTQTQKQVNRVDNREKIEQLRALGVFCSCGKLIADERVEELFVPSPALQRLLDQSFWMSARLVRVLGELGVSADRILLNLQEGAQEIDAFVDLEGTLLMFELKDNEFSMGHAYPFGGRVGLYKPQFAFIVATNGIAADVKQYLTRVKPEAEIVYVGNMEELPAKLAHIIEKIHSQRARSILFQFESLADIQAPLTEILGRRLRGDKMPALPAHAAKAS